MQITKRQWTIGGVMAVVAMVGTVAGSFVKIDEAYAKLHDWKVAFWAEVVNYAVSKTELEAERRRLEIERRQLEKAIAEGKLQVADLNKRIAAGELIRAETRSLELDKALAKWQGQMAVKLAKPAELRETKEFKDDIDSLQANIDSTKKLIVDNDDRINKLRFESGK
jgi:chromosome segregation ATPase